jgi:hypothetical protein
MPKHFLLSLRMASAAVARGVLFCLDAAMQYRMVFLAIVCLFGQNLVLDKCCMDVLSSSVISLGSLHIEPSCGKSGLV